MLDLGDVRENATRTHKSPSNDNPTSAGMTESTTAPSSAEDADDVMPRQVDSRRHNHLDLARACQREVIADT
jgi:hypothetical protein